MPGYIERALARFQHSIPKRPQNSPHAWQIAVYGALTQYAAAADTSDALSTTDATKIMHVLWILLSSLHSTPLLPNRPHRPKIQCMQPFTCFNIVLAIPMLWYDMGLVPWSFGNTTTRRTCPHQKNDRARAVFTFSATDRSRRSGPTIHLQHTIEPSIFSARS